VEVACNKASRHKVGNVKRLRKPEDGKSLEHGKAKDVKREALCGETLRGKKP